MPSINKNAIRGNNKNNISLFPPIRRVYIQKNIYTMQITMEYNR